MENIQTICPTCQTKYFVSMMHLSVAQGIVNCGQCHSTFNAYYYMPSKHSLAQQNETNENEQIFKLAKYSALEIFHTQNSASTNLLTHLNNTNHRQVSSEVLSETQTTTRKYSPWALLILIIISLLLVLTLIFNIIHYNTNLLSKIPFGRSLSSYNNCMKNSCLSNTQEMIQVKVSKVEENYPYTTTITGSIENLNTDTESLPKLMLTVNLTKTQLQSFSLTPEMYLPYYFRNKTKLLRKQKIDFRIDVPFSYNNIHSIELKTAELSRPS